MYDKTKILTAIELVCKACDLIEDLPQEVEPLSYTEPVNKMAMALDDFLEGAESFLKEICKEAE